jgi:flagellar biosynthesis anti-sigma factor FlgM
MKIEDKGQGHGIEKPASGRVRNETDSQAARRTGDPAPNADTVSISSDADLARAALKAAGDPAAIRLELVEKMRAMVARGEVGGNPEALADAILDRLAEE